MELLTILLSSLLSVVSPAGLVIDTVAENALRSQLERVEQLEVRVDNTPNYQILQGKVERVRIAGRGLWLTPEMRIDALELETDPIDLDIQSIREGGRESAAKSLRQPLQAGMRLVLTESDINQALQSPTVMSQLQEIGGRFLRGATEDNEVKNPRLELLENQRIRFQMEVRKGETQPVAVIVESGLSVTAGHTLELIEPVVSIDGNPLPPQLVAGFATGLSNRYNLRSLEDAGIMARLLQLEISTDKLELAAFVRFEPTNN
ncbi:MAG TPA: DUF2993 domain-containing protein [Cyanobacteria bacterium UBA9273]|nr:DUF2993 domain-containing protein [Cyanobacteria bacterium UBA9273]